MIIGQLSLNSSICVTTKAKEAFLLTSAEPGGQGKLEEILSVTTQSCAWLQKFKFHIQALIPASSSWHFLAAAGISGLGSFAKAMLWEKNVITTTLTRFLNQKWYRFIINQWLPCDILPLERRRVKV